MASTLQINMSKGWDFMKQKNFKQQLSYFAVTALVVSGVYNSVMVSSGDFSSKNNIRFVKRLDEVYGVVKVGRKLANIGKWQKIEPIIAKEEILEKATNKIVSAPEVQNEVVEAAIQDELELEVLEVFNAKKYHTKLDMSQFDGHLSTRDGRIESLKIDLPKGESLDIFYSNMVGNVFEFKQDGQVVSGMMYQIDEESYMVTITSGEHEGLRVKFGTRAAQTRQEEALYEKQVAQTEKYDDVYDSNGDKLNVGNFGEEIQQPEVQIREQEEGLSYSFNFEGSEETANL